MRENTLNKSDFLRIGLIGYNKSNGHFFSYPAIINGYNKKLFKLLKWPIIFDYLEKEKIKKFNIRDARVTSIWCQNYNLSKKISRACYIKESLKNYKEMLGKVDCVIIARDDWKSHIRISNFFLKKKIKTFIDKPLTLSKKELIFFSKYLKNKLVMSCSSFRFTKELTKIKKLKFDTIKLFTVNDFDKYAIHMLELAYILGFKKIYKYKHVNNVIFINTNRGKIYLSLSNKNKNHSAEFYSKNKLLKKIIFKDNFNMFKKTIKYFINFCKEKYNNHPIETIHIIKNMIKLKKIYEK